MPKFRFIVQAPSGKVRRGTITESDELSARRQLEEAGFKVVSLTESSDLVVHTPAGTSAGGRTAVKPQRAAIIDFEETPWERLIKAFNFYILRREFAVVLGIVGVVWMVAGSFGGPEKQAPAKLDYKEIKVVVKVDVAGSEADMVEVRLPEIPYRVTEPLELGNDGIQEVVLDFESSVVPSEVEVKLLEGDQVEAEDKGTLSSKGEGWEFLSSPQKVSAQ